MLENWRKFSRIFENKRLVSLTSENDLKTREWKDNFKIEQTLPVSLLDNQLETTK